MDMFRIGCGYAVFDQVAAGDEQFHPRWTFHFTPTSGSWLNAVESFFTEARKFTLPSFDEYFAPYEHGAGGIGQNYVALPAEIRRDVREDVRRHVGDAGGPIEIEQEIRIATARKPIP